MNKKVQTIFLMLFLAICAGTAISDSVFPVITAAIKLLIFVTIIFCLWISCDNLFRYIRAYNRLKKETIYKLLFKSGIKSFIVNALTVYRIIITPVLMILLFYPGNSIKLWLLASAFISDALDGFLARKLKVTSKLGAKLDSIADDLLFIVALTYIIIIYPEIIIQHIYIVSFLGILFIFKMIVLWFKHDKLISGMHTYIAKGAAVLQAIFFIHTAFFHPSEILFYIAVYATIIAIIEESILIYFLRELRPNIKGLFNRSQL